MCVCVCVCVCVCERKEFLLNSLWETDRLIRAITFLNKRMSCSSKDIFNLQILSNNYNVLSYGKMD